MLQLITLKQINAHLRQELPQKPPISISTLAAILDRQLITMKKLDDAPVERNSLATKEKRHMVNCRRQPKHDLHGRLQI